MYVRRRDVLHGNRFSDAIPLNSAASNIQNTLSRNKFRGGKMSTLIIRTSVIPGQCNARTDEASDSHMATSRDTIELTSLSLFALLLASNASLLFQACPGHDNVSKLVTETATVSRHHRRSTRICSNNIQSCIATHLCGTAHPVAVL